MTRRLFLVLAILLATAGPLTAQLPARTFSDPMATPCGPLVGEVRDGVISFKGVPYAQPPVGPLRWQPPQPLAPWKAPLLATAFGPTCPQGLTRASADQPVTSTDFFGPVGTLSEDCLHLNVWTPQQRAKALPVFVFLHGGGFQAGSGVQPMYDGTRLARRGAVVVTVDFRLGAFGFLSLPGLRPSGNYGIMDMIAALRWVRDNISALGGDPRKVTIVGQSGGAVSVLALMTSPRAAGLFGRAISHSGMMPPTFRAMAAEVGTLPSMQSLGEAFARSLQAAAPDALRCLSWVNILQAWKVPVDVGLISNVGGAGIMAAPEIDGDVFPRAPDVTFAAGQQQPVPLLIGNVADEGTMFVPPFDTLDRYRALLAQAVGADHLEEALRTYPARDVTEAHAAYVRMCTDLMIAISRRHARWQSKIQPKTFTWFFTRTPPWERSSWVKCFHGSDLAYLFGNFPQQLAYEPQDTRLSEQVMDYWIAFADTGDPNHPGAPRWPAFTDGQRAYLQLDVPVGTGLGLRDEACDRFDRWWGLAP